MYQQRCAVTLSLFLALAISACGSDDDGDDNTSSSDPATSGPATSGPADTSMLDPNSAPDTSGEPGGPTPNIAGLWDASEPSGDTTNILYFNISDNGVISSYDYQQDGVEFATGENCYIKGDDRTLSPEGGDNYAIQGVAITAINDGESLMITFQEPDSKDFDEDGDVEETPELRWPAVTTATLADLNECDG